MQETQYLIIAGISKAGTTSLYNYLADHPQVKSSTIKQTFFFLDKNLQDKLNLKSVYDYENGLKQFKNFFIGDDKQVKYRLEATPDYLYSHGTAERLASFFKTNPGKILIILRDPVSRFNSFFYYGKQEGLIPKKMDYKTFYEQSKNYMKNINPCLMAYKTGFYAQYIKQYKAIFGENMRVIFFRSLKDNPKVLLQNLCEFFELSDQFYENYEFKVKNKTVQARNQTLTNVYGKMRQFYLNHFYKSRLGKNIATALNKTITPMYRKINYQSLEKNKGDHVINKILRKEYDEDIPELKKLIQRSIPWE